MSTCDLLLSATSYSSFPCLIRDFNIGSSRVSLALTCFRRDAYSVTLVGRAKLNTLMLDGTLPYPVSDSVASIETICAVWGPNLFSITSSVYGWYVAEKAASLQLEGTLSKIWARFCQHPFLFAGYLCIFVTTLSASSMIKTLSASRLSQSRSIVTSIRRPRVAKTTRGYPTNSYLR